MPPIDRHESRAVLFADISGSTKLYVNVGDERAREIVARTLDVWGELTAQCGGNVVQLRGDGMLCTFPSADAALDAAVRMRDLPYPEPLSMHAGINSGAILQDAEQLYGDVVNVAARMADIAKRFEIVLTADAKQQLADSPRWRNLRLIRQVPVKGKAAPMDVYLLADDRRALTDYHPPARRAASSRLTLRYLGTAILVDEQTTSCVVGRDNDCRLKVDHRLVSRRHATVEWTGGKFFLHDHSTNGTYVREQRGNPVLVHRELCQLNGSGVISLGIEPAHNVEHSIVFSLEQ